MRHTYRNDGPGMRESFWDAESLAILAAPSGLALERAAATSPRAIQVAPSPTRAAPNRAASAPAFRWTDLLCG